MILFNNLIDALRDVSDLDSLQALTASNEQADIYAPPLRDWLLQLYRAERDRRETGREPAYPHVQFTELPAGPLLGVTTFSLQITEAALMIGNPAIQNFALRLQALLVWSLGYALVKKEAAEHGKSDSDR